MPVDIQWHGGGWFRLRGGQGTVITDPLADDARRRAALRADIVVFSHPVQKSRALASSEEAFVIDSPGEYEIRGIFVIGVPFGRRGQGGPDAVFSIAYTITLDDVSICYLPAVDQQPTQSQIDALGNVDVLIVPISGGTSLNAAQAAEVVRLVDPAIVIPSHPRPTGTGDGDAVTRFCQELGATGLEPQETLRVVAGRLPEGPQVVLLQLRH